jgi:hypothetical protein
MKPQYFYNNSQWAVTDFGLECLTVDYPIGASRLDETTHRNGETLADWIVHMVEKVWIDFDQFVDAYRHALEIHKDRHGREVTPEMVERSVQYAKTHSFRYGGDPLAGIL